MLVFHYYIHPFHKAARAKVVIYYIAIKINILYNETLKLNTKLYLIFRLMVVTLYWNYINFREDLLCIVQNADRKSEIILRFARLCGELLDNDSVAEQKPKRKSDSRAKSISVSRPNSISVLRSEPVSKSISKLRSRAACR